DFLVHPPSPTKPFEILPGTLQVTGFMPYALRDVKVEVSERDTDGPALRFVLENDRANVTDWMVLNAATATEMIEMGPAKVYFSKSPNVPVTGNAIVLVPRGDGVKYTVYTA